MTSYQEERAPAYRWVVIGSLTSCAATALTSIFVLGLILPDISDELHLSPSQQGWLGSSLIFANLIFSIPMNLWLARFPPWRVGTLAFLGVAVFTFLQGWAPNFGVLILARIALGLCFISSQAPRALIIQQWTPYRRLSFTQGVLFGAIDIIMGIAFFLTPILVEALDGWRNTLYALSGFAFLVAGLWMVLGRERVTPAYRERMHSQVGTPLRTLLKYKQLWIMGAGMAAAMLSQSAFQTFWPTYAEEDLHISATLVGVAFGLMTLATGPTDFMVNAVPALVRRQPLVVTVCALATVGTFLALLYLESEALVILMSVIRGLFASFFPVLMIMPYHLPGITPQEVVVGVGFMQTTIWVGSSLGPLIVGFLQESTGDLRLALLVTTFTPLALVITAVVLQGQGAGKAAYVSAVPDPKA